MVCHNEVEPTQFETALTRIVHRVRAYAFMALVCGSDVLRSRAELGRLSDRELADIGIDRDMIQDMGEIEANRY